MAARLGSGPLEDWLLWESNGYQDDIDVPSYRIWAIELKGHFTASFGREMRNVPIPTICLPENIRHTYRNHKCRQGIASIEETLKQESQMGSGTLQVSTGDLSVLLGN